MLTFPRLFEPWKGHWPYHNPDVPSDFFVKINPGDGIGRQLPSTEAKTGKVVKIQFRDYAQVTELQVRYSPVIIEFGKLKLIIKNLSHASVIGPEN